MKIVILGANGQVASEVALILNDMAGVEVVPVSRTRNGSAFLRSRGVAVRHGSITDLAQARGILQGADVVANFALATGAGKSIVDANHAIIDASIAYAPDGAAIIFFSTLATQGIYDQAGDVIKNAYGDLKRRNEAHFERKIRKSGHRGWTLRLGHVCGDEQNITQAIREEIGVGPVLLHDAERLSNTTDVVAIVEALLSIGDGRADVPGRYDLVNTPQWTWREVYEREAAKLRLPLTIEAVLEPKPMRLSMTQRGRGIAFNTIGRLGLRPALERALAYLPTQAVSSAKADYAINRVRHEIQALARSTTPPNAASWWPSLETKNLNGQRETIRLITDSRFSGAATRPPWPADL